MPTTSHSLPDSDRVAQWVHARQQFRDERRALLDAIDVPLLCLSEDDRICEANAAAVQLFSAPEAELVGQSVMRLIKRPLGRVPGTTKNTFPVSIEGSGRGMMMTRKPLSGIGPARDLVSFSPLRRAIRASRPREDITCAPAEPTPARVTNLVGRSDAIRRVCRLVGKAAPADANVLIQGESGTGKEVCAKSIHALSKRADRSFVGVNCAALNQSLLESELFGHVKGAFTGAIRNRQGRFRQAHGGTILLDEIGAMPLAAQCQLLRVLQERSYEPVGSSETIAVNVRVIATTNVDLARAVKTGEFREDLYYRLNVIVIEMPPLRSRRDDIPLLASTFIARFNDKLGKHLRGMSSDALELLLNHPWPGNVRQLENTLERACVLEDSEIIHPVSLGIDDEAAVPEIECLKLREQLQILERHIVVDTLERVNWVRKSAAEQLGIDPKNFNYFLKKHNISQQRCER